MFQILNDIAYTLRMSSGKGQKQYEEERQQQVREASKECPSLTAKRQAAIEYLGDRWLLAKKVDRLNSPRTF